MRIFLAAVFLLIPAAVFAESAGQAGNLVVNYTPELGRTVLYAGENVSYSGSADNLVLQFSMRFTEEITVVGRLADGYAINAVGRNVEVQSDQPIIGDLIAKVMGLVEDVPVRYEVGAAGSPIRVINLAELNAVFKETIAELKAWVVEFTTSLGLAKAQAEQVHGALAAMLQPFTNMTEAAASQVFLEEPNLFGLVVGAEFPLGRTRTYETGVVWQLVGANLTARGSFEVVSYDAGSNEATIIWRNSYDPDSVIAAVAIYMQNVADQMGGEVGAKIAAQINALQDYDVSETAEIRVRPSNGDILELSYTKLSTMQGQVQKATQHYLRQGE